jgi:hypothetical protein
MTWKPHLDEATFRESFQIQLDQLATHPLSPNRSFVPEEEQIFPCQTREKLGWQNRCYPFLRVEKFQSVRSLSFA